MVEEEAPEIITTEPAPADQTPPPLGQSFGIRSWLQEFLETLLLALVIFFVVNTITGRYQVHGQSMDPNLHDGQYLIASKITYWLHPPERGDIVVLHPPEGQGTVPYIKRVIGLPGDQVQIHDGRVWVNGVALHEPYISDPPAYVGDWTVAPNEYFVLGDNRNNSSDSHAWGLLPREQVIGKAIFCYWPPKYWGPIPHYSFPELEAIP